MSSTGLTKEQLRNQLITHGITLPPSTAKKEEYQKLFDEYVKNVASKQEFSSDEETDPKVQTKSSTSESKPTSSKVQNAGFKQWVEKMKRSTEDEKLELIKRLTDIELFEYMNGLGLKPGPVLHSTRLLYEKILFNKIQGKTRTVQNHYSNGKESQNANGVNGDFNFSDSDGEIPKTSPAEYRTKNSSITTRKTKKIINPNAIKTDDTPTPPLTMKRNERVFARKSGRGVENAVDATMEFSRRSISMHSHRVGDENQPRYRNLISATESEVQKNKLPHLVDDTRAKTNSSALLIFIVFLIALACIFTYLFYTARPEKDELDEVMELI